MPDLTQNLGLQKPLDNETADIAVINGNMDVIDAEVVKKASQTQDGRMSKEDKTRLDNLSAADVGSVSANGGTSITTGDAKTYAWKNGTFNVGTAVTSMPVSNHTWIVDACVMDSNNIVLYVADQTSTGNYYTLQKVSGTWQTNWTQSQNALGFIPAPSGYGLGTGGSRQATGADLNTLTKAGWYDVQNPVNGVSGLTWHAILVCPSNDPNYITQYAFAMTENSGNVYVRQKNNGTWGSWNQVMTSVGGTIVGALNVNLADVQDANFSLGASKGNRYVKINPRAGAGNYNPLIKADDAGIIFTNNSSGNTNTGGLLIAPWSPNAYGIRLDATGTITLSGGNVGVVNSNGGDANLSIENTAIANTSFRRKIIYSTPNDGHSGDGWLFRSWRPSDGAVIDFHLPSGSANGSYNILTTASMGTGSGIDSDSVDGVHVTGSSTTGLRRITTSTSAPSGGSDGDIWIQYV